MHDLHIVILDYKKADKVLQNVASLLQQKTQYSYTITVVDNSVDENNAQILTQLPAEVECITHDTNIGYTRAYNDILKKSSARFFAIVNPDIYWEDEKSLEKMIQHMDSNPSIGILAPEQIEGKKHALTVRAFPHLSVQIIRRTMLKHFPILKTIVIQDEYSDGFDTQSIQAVPWVQSSCIITPKKVFDLLGGFDERYFLFMSDTEYCIQAWKKGFSTIYFPSVKVQADGIRASDGGVLSLFKKPTVRIHLRDAITYQMKHLFTSFSSIMKKISITNKDQRENNNRS